MDIKFDPKLKERSFTQSIFYQIMEFCTLKELALAQLVCRQWCHWVDQPYLFKNVEYSTEEQHIQD